VAQTVVVDRDPALLISSHGSHRHRHTHTHTIRRIGMRDHAPHTRHDVMIVLRVLAETSSYPGAQRAQRTIWCLLAGWLAVICQDRRKERLCLVTSVHGRPIALSRCVAGLGQNCSSCCQFRQRKATESPLAAPNRRPNACGRPPRDPRWFTFSAEHIQLSKQNRLQLLSPRQPADNAW